MILDTEDMSIKLLLNYEGNDITIERIKKYNYKNGKIIIKGKIIMKGGSVVNRIVFKELDNLDTLRYIRLICDFVYRLTVIESASKNLKLK